MMATQTLEYWVWSERALAFINVTAVTRFGGRLKCVADLCGGAHEALRSRTSMGEWWLGFAELCAAWKVKSAVTVHTKIYASAEAHSHTTRLNRLLS